MRRCTHHALLQNSKSFCLDSFIAPLVCSSNACNCQSVFAIATSLASVVSHVTASLVTRANAMVPANSAKFALYYCTSLARTRKHTAQRARSTLATEIRGDCIVVFTAALHCLLSDCDVFTPTVHCLRGVSMTPTSTSRSSTSVT